MREGTSEGRAELGPAESVVISPGESLLDINEQVRSTEALPPQDQVVTPAAKIEPTTPVVTEPVPETSVPVDDVMNLTDPGQIEAGITDIFEAGSGD